MWGEVASTTTSTFTLHIERDLTHLVSFKLI